MQLSFFQTATEYHIIFLTQSYKQHFTWTCWHWCQWYLWWVHSYLMFLDIVSGFLLANVKFSHIQENCVSYLNLGAFWVIDLVLKKKFFLFGGAFCFGGVDKCSSCTGVIDVSLTFTVFISAPKNFLNFGFLRYYYVFFFCFFFSRTICINVTINTKVLLSALLLPATALL